MVKKSFTVQELSTFANFKRVGKKVQCSCPFGCKSSHLFHWNGVLSTGKCFHCGEWAFVNDGLNVKKDNDNFYSFIHNNMSSVPNVSELNKIGVGWSKVSKNTNKKMMSCVLDMHDEYNERMTKLSEQYPEETADNLAVVYDEEKCQARLNCLENTNKKDSKSVAYRIYSDELGVFNSNEPVYTEAFLNKITNQEELNSKKWKANVGSLWNAGEDETAVYYTGNINIDGDKKGIIIAENILIDGNMPNCTIYANPNATGGANHIADKKVVNSFFAPKKPTAEPIVVPTVEDFEAIMTAPVAPSQTPHPTPIVVDAVTVPPAKTEQIAAISYTTDDLPF